MLVLDYIQSGELYHGENLFGQPDVLNRPLKGLVAGLANGEADVKAGNVIYKVDSAVDFEATVVDTDLVIYDNAISKFRKYDYFTDDLTHVILGFADVTNEMVILSGFYSFFSGLSAGAKYYADSTTAGGISIASTSVYVGNAIDATTLFIDIKAGFVDSVNGHVGAVVLTQDDVGLDAIDNTSDLDKPISSATALALADKLDISAYTASDILTKLKTVDGAGSGLDADLLDGKSSASFNQIIGTDTDVNASVGEVIDYINVTDGVIQSMGKRTLGPSDIGMDVSGVAGVYPCRAWIRFNGASISASISKNITSVTDGGVGIYTVNIATDMASSSYAVVASCLPHATINQNYYVGADVVSAGSFVVRTKHGVTTYSYVDVGEIDCAVFG